MHTGGVPAVEQTGLETQKNRVSGVVCGIDPGASGALAMVAANGSLVAVHDMPVIEVLVNRKPRPRVTAAGVAAVLRGYDVGHWSASARCRAKARPRHSRSACPAG